MRENGECMPINVLLSLCVILLFSLIVVRCLECFGFALPKRLKASSAESVNPYVPNGATLWKIFTGTLNSVYTRQ